jgi:transcriptional regulator of acetoin/glycerol metabolism
MEGKKLYQNGTAQPAEKAGINSLPRSGRYSIFSTNEVKMLNPTIHAERNVLRAHDLMRQSGQAPHGLVPAVIESSWRRCLKGGLGMEDKPQFDPVLRNTLDAMRQRNIALIRHALPIMETLYEQIANTQSMVVLSDATGYILHSLGDDDFLARAQRVALSPGVEWSEGTRGTNAIGTALAEKTPVVVHGAQHYLPSNHFLTCSAAPLLDPHGEIIGVLDVTGDHRSFSPHTLALANMSARMIENHLFCHTFSNAFLVRLHARPEFLGTLCEGLAAFGEDGRLLSANQSGCFQFGLSGPALREQSYASLFGVSLHEALDLAAHAAPSPCQLQLHNGIRVFVRIESRARKYPSEKCIQADVPGRLEQPASFSAKSEFPALRQLAEQSVLRCTPLLLQGENAAAMAAFAESLRQRMPANSGWLEIDCNCAADEQFEELLRRIMRRSPLDAHDAIDVFFLSDVGRLSLLRQSRLVIALQTGLQPNGAEHCRAIIATSNGKLKGQVVRKAFREDLYFRLSGRVITLPRGERVASETSGDLEAITRQAIEATLDAQGGNISATARRLGISRSTLYRHLRGN